MGFFRFVLNLCNCSRVLGLFIASSLVLFIWVLYHPLFGSIFYSTDQSTVVMMANRAVFGWSELFFWGQDLLGMWTVYPNKIFASFSLYSSPGIIFLQQAGAILCGLLVFGNIMGIRGVAFLYLGSVTLGCNWYYSRGIFDICMPYGWSFAVFCFYCSTVVKISQKNSSIAKMLFLLALVFILSFLGVWLSPINVLLFTVSTFLILLLAASSLTLKLVGLMGGFIFLEIGLAWVLFKQMHYQFLFYFRRINETEIDIRPLEYFKNLDHIFWIKPGAIIPWMSWLGFLTGIIICITLVVSPRFRVHVKASAFRFFATCLLGGGSAYFAVLPMLQWVVHNDYQHRYFIFPAFMSAFGLIAFSYSYLHRQNALLKIAFCIAVSSLHFGSWFPWEVAIPAPENVATLALTHDFDQRVKGRVLLRGSNNHVYGVSSLLPHRQLVRIPNEIVRTRHDLKEVGKVDRYAQFGDSYSRPFQMIQGQLFLFDERLNPIESHQINIDLYRSTKKFRNESIENNLHAKLAKGNRRNFLMPCIGKCTLVQLGAKECPIFSIRNLDNQEKIQPQIYEDDSIWHFDSDAVIFRSAKNELQCRSLKFVFVQNEGSE